MIIVLPKTEEPPTGETLIQLLHDPKTVNERNLLELRDDRLRVAGLMNLVATAESEMKRIANKYLERT